MLHPNVLMLQAMVGVPQHSVWSCVNSMCRCSRSACGSHLAHAHALYAAQRARCLQEVDARIKESQAELERSKVYRQQQEECEVLKESIMTLPARADTEREIAQVRAETEELERESAQLDSDIEVRRSAAVGPPRSRAACVGSRYGMIVRVWRRADVRWAAVQLRRKQFAHLSVVLQNLTASIRERAEPAHDGGTMDVDA